MCTDKRSQIDFTTKMVYVHFDWLAIMSVIFQFRLFRVWYAEVCRRRCKLAIDILAGVNSSALIRFQSQIELVRTI